MDERVTEDEQGEGEEGLPAEVRLALKDWETSYGDWATSATTAYDMLAGKQWTVEDSDAMREARRPTVTMNRLAAMIRGVCGMQVSQRMEARYIAREMGDVQAVEVQNAAAKWVREGCDADDEESEAFRDMVTCGMGWTETRISYDEDPEGKIYIERIDPLDMRWDPIATKKNVADSRWRARLKRMHTSELKRLWPGKADEITAYLESDPEIGASPHVTKAGDNYSDATMPTRPSPDNEVIVVQYQYFEHVYMVKVLDPVAGKAVDVPEERYNAMPREMQTQVLQRFKTRVFRQAIVCGGVELEDRPLNVSHFTLNCMTGVRDRNEGTWYGLVRDLVEPQRWSNKFFSSIIDTLATNAKGGVMAETTAVEDTRKFEKDWADPRKTVWLKPGGAAKIQPRPQPNIPPALGQMMEFAGNNLPLISGINLEFLGTTDRNQPGILEYHRKQSVANSLAEFFASMRQYRKNAGVVLLEMIYLYIADGRLIRIVGKEGESYIPLYKQATVKYDVVVDEASNSPDRKMQAWMALEQLIPVALKAGMPIPPEALDYSPLPQPLVQAWKDLINKGPQIPPEVQEQMQKLQEENAQLKDKKQEAQAQLSIDAQHNQQQIQLEQAKAAAKMQLEREQMQHEMQLEEMRLNHQMRIETMKAQGTLELNKQKAMLDAAIKEEQVMASAGGVDYTFEKENGRIKSVKDKSGKKYVVDRDDAGGLRGLRAETETIQ